MGVLGNFPHNELFVFAAYAHKWVFLYLLTNVCACICSQWVPCICVFACICSPVGSWQADPRGSWRGSGGRRSPRAGPWCSTSYFQTQESAHCSWKCWCNHTLPCQILTENPYISSRWEYFIESWGVTVLVLAVSENVNFYCLIFFWSCLSSSSSNWYFIQCIARILWTNFS